MHEIPSDVAALDRDQAHREIVRLREFVRRYIEEESAGERAVSFTSAMLDIVEHPTGDGPPVKILGPLARRAFEIGAAHAQRLVALRSALRPFISAAEVYDDDGLAVDVPDAAVVDARGVLRLGDLRSAHAIYKRTPREIPASVSTDHRPMLRAKHEHPGAHVLAPACMVHTTVEEWLSSLLGLSTSDGVITFVRMHETHGGELLRVHVTKEQP